MRRNILFALAAMLFSGVALFAADAPAGTKDIQVKSSIDGDMQPCALYVPENYKADKAIPMVVILHSWGSDYKPSVGALNEAKRKGWIGICANYRGGNQGKWACASPNAVQDIVDVVDYICKNYTIDKKRIYLFGASGGGHMAMMMAGRHPGIWAAVSEWCGISDLGKWCEEHRKGKSLCSDKKFSQTVFDNLKAICGGVPGKNEKVDKEYFERSPINFIQNAKDLNISFNHGKNDELVAYHHSEDAYNKLIAAGGKKAELNLHNNQHAADAKKAFDWFETKTKE